MIAEILKSLNTERMTLDEAVEVAALGKVLRAEYVTQGIPTPDFVSYGLAELDREIKSRKIDLLQKRLRQQKQRVETLKPAEVQRQESEEQINALQKELESLGVSA